RQSVSTLLRLHSTENSEFMDDRGRKAAGEQLMKMLGDPKQQADAQAILRRPRSTDDVTKVLAILNDPKQAATGKILTSMLRSENAGERQSARILIESLGDAPRAPGSS